MPHHDHAQERGLSIVPGRLDLGLHERLRLTRRKEAAGSEVFSELILKLVERQIEGLPNRDRRHRPTESPIQPHRPRRDRPGRRVGELDACLVPEDLDIEDLGLAKFGGEGSALSDGEGT